MRRARWAGLLAVGVLALSGLEARAVEQEAINRAVDGGVDALRKMQREDGTWPHAKLGATALAGLTLVECGVRPGDKAVSKALAAVRADSVGLSDTYSLALSILFLDRVDDPADVPLIESMAVRLLAGQGFTGGWAYSCPPPNALEMRRLMASVRRVNELKARRELPKLPPKGGRTVKDLPKEIRARLDLIGRVGPVGRNPSDTVGGDNSNTQFATLGLWVSRRYGLPVQKALQRVDARFRRSQSPDGGWGYLESSTMHPPPPPGLPAAPVVRQMNGATATMTCAGILGLAAAHGGAADLARARDSKARPRDISKDRRMRAALQALALAVGRPTGAWRERGGRRMALRADGKAYYFLWSLERVAVALNLETIGKKDWYNWGAEVLLANQQGDGSWHGEYGGSGADTCFALLFLRQANFTSDLSTSLKLTDPGGKALRAGGIGGGALKGPPEVLKPTDIGGEKAKPDREAKAPSTGPKERPADRPKPPAAREESPARRLGRDLVGGSGERQRSALGRLRESKGVAYTEALAGAIPRLEGDIKGKAREALAERLGRMKATTLRSYLEDEDSELRRAAALACAVKESKELIPDLIRLLNDPEPTVDRAAYAALKDLSGKDFGPPARATRAERARAISAWQAWWRKETRE
jgi:hypothetical protein